MMMNPMMMGMMGGGGMPMMDAMNQANKDAVKMTNDSPMTKMMDPVKMMQQQAKYNQDALHHSQEFGKGMMAGADKMMKDANTLHAMTGHAHYNPGAAGMGMMPMYGMGLMHPGYGIHGLRAGYGGLGHAGLAGGIGMYNPMMMNPMANPMVGAMMAANAGMSSVKGSSPMHQMGAMMGAHGALAATNSMGAGMPTPMMMGLPNMMGTYNFQHYGMPNNAGMMGAGGAMMGGGGTRMGMGMGGMMGTMGGFGNLGMPVGGTGMRMKGKGSLQGQQQQQAQGQEALQSMEGMQSMGGQDEDQEHMHHHLNPGIMSHLFPMHKGSVSQVHTAGSGLASFLQLQAYAHTRNPGYQLGNGQPMSGFGGGAQSGGLQSPGMMPGMGGGGGGMMMPGMGGGQVMQQAQQPVMGQGGSMQQQLQPSSDQPPSLPGLSKSDSSGKPAPGTVDGLSGTQFMAGPDDGPDNGPPNALKQQAKNELADSFMGGSAKTSVKLGSPSLFDKLNHDGEMASKHHETLDSIK
jgi:hypothetical protein